MKRFFGELAWFFAVLVGNKRALPDPRPALGVELRLTITWGP